MKQLIECVPNFSEGRDHTILQQITQTIEAVEGDRIRIRRFRLSARREVHVRVEPD